jgi:SUMO ligase MMS21 Smc5/6 complex component
VLLHNIEIHFYIAFVHPHILYADEIDTNTCLTKVDKSKILRHGNVCQTQHLLVILLESQTIPVEKLRVHQLLLQEYD